MPNISLKLKQYLSQRNRKSERTKDIISSAAVTRGILSVAVNTSCDELMSPFLSTPPFSPSRDYEAIFCGSQNLIIACDWG
jgi:hypothetical protein